ncbi:MAG: tetratricopeptide repeat protein, partial [Alphaproteobacteria bacterium]
GLGAIEPDLDKARRWYEAAARQGDANAQTNLGVMYATGLGAPQDDDIAERWFRLAAAQGNQDAQDNLGALMRRKLTK